MHANSRDKHLVLCMDLSFNNVYSRHHNFNDALESLWDNQHC
jgi:hypothetical protein